ncbi:MAG: VWA domain-containing protein [Acidobacteriota bacterium]
MACAAALAVLVLSPPVGATEGEPFEDSSAVTLVEVPVNVVNRDGEPVRGLTLEDFQVFDDGKRQDLAGLEVIDLEVLQPSRAEVKRTVQRLPAVARRHFLMLFDLSFSSPASIVRARKAARDFVLDHLHPTDLAAVATFSIEQGPQLLITFTPDRAQLARAIDTLGAPGLTQRGHVVDPLRFVIEPPTLVTGFDDQLDSTNSSGSATDVAVSQYLSIIQMQRQRSERTFQSRRISAWSRALGDMARSLASMQGRKHVVYFSEGFDGSLLLGRDASRSNVEAQQQQFYREQGLLQLVDQDRTFGSSALQGDISEMLEQFRRADCLIQAVDIAGLRPETSVSGMSANAVSPRLNDQTDALFYVSDATGGTLFEDANDLGRQLSKVLERNSVTYVLSYYPKDLEANGKYHKLKVKSDLPRGTRLSHRAGYYAPRSYQDMHPMEKALLASEAIASAAPRRELDLRMLAAPFRASPDLAYVPVILELPGKSLLAGHGSEELGLEIYIYATNSKGEMRDFLTQIVTFDLQQQRRNLYQTGIKYYGHLELTPDDYLIRVLARNNETGKTAVASQNLRVPEYEQMAPAILPPFFVEAPNQWFMVRERAPEDGRDTVVYPFTINGEPYVPAAKPVVTSGEDSRLCVVAYNLGAGRVRLDGRVFGDEGVLHDEGELSLIERTVTGIDGVDKLLASFDPQGLLAGEYTLNVAITNLETGLEQRSSIPIVVN